MPKLCLSSKVQSIAGLACSRYEHFLLPEKLKKFNSELELELDLELIEETNKIKEREKWNWKQWGNTWRKEEVRMTRTHPLSMDCLSGSSKASLCKAFVSISLNQAVSSAPSKSPNVYWFLLLLKTLFCFSLYIIHTITPWVYSVIQRIPISFYHLICGFCLWIYEFKQN